ncbi:MAG: hypothetical protein CHACPFDD_00812 [Phycisphaerae bacterium]|nr:hypothetical protein [Phycisphaerae bacterium]
MPLKIRCPHCRRVLLADETIAGEQRACPGCGRPLSVPVPIRNESVVAPAAHTVGAACSHCGAESAPGAVVCRRCHRDLASGRRLPILRRVALVSLRTWTILVASFAGLAVCVGAAISLLSPYWRGEHEPAVQTAAASAPASRPMLAQLAERLLRATSADERMRLAAEIGAQGSLATGHVAAALGQARRESATVARPLNQLAAIRLLGEHPAAEAVAVLTGCLEDAALRDEAAWALAMNGDGREAARVAERWALALRRAMFAARLAALSREAVSPGAVELSLSRLRRQRDALRRLGAEGFMAAAAALWDGWDYLGQERDEVFSSELFAIARGQSDDIDVRTAVEESRIARDVLSRAIGEGSAGVKAAACVVLVRHQPQYRVARERAIPELAGLLPACAPLDQQRLTWTLALLTGRSFGAVDSERSPADVGRDDVLAVVQWARTSQIAKPGPLRTPPADYRPAPRVGTRVATVRRQEQLDLLRRMELGWNEARGATRDWLAAGFGFTPELRRLADPSRSPVAPAALCASLTVAASRPDESWRPALVLWCEARDQPVWVRTMAETVRAVWDVRAGAARPTWPAGLDFSDVGTGPGPAWDDFGLIIAAAGDTLMARLARPDAPAAHRALLDAARRAQTARR